MKKIKEIVLTRTYKTLSPLERTVVETLIKFQGLHFEINFKVGYYYVDIAFPKHKVGLEIDGHEYHSTEKQIMKDELREEYLTEVQGWKIERVPGWFCYRYPEISAAKVLRHIPEVKDHPLYIDFCIQAKQWFARELLNTGHKEAAIKIFSDLRN